VRPCLSSSSEEGGGKKGTEISFVFHVSFWLEKGEKGRRERREGGKRLSSYTSGKGKKKKKFSQ